MLSYPIRSTAMSPRACLLRTALSASKLTVFLISENLSHRSRSSWLYSRTRVLPLCLPHCSVTAADSPSQGHQPQISKTSGSPLVSQGSDFALLEALALPALLWQLWAAVTMSPVISFWAHLCKKEKKKKEEYQKFSKQLYWKIHSHPPPFLPRPSSERTRFLILIWNFLCLVSCAK